MMELNWEVRDDTLKDYEKWQAALEDVDKFLASLPYAKPGELRLDILKRMDQLIRERGEIIEAQHKKIMILLAKRAEAAELLRSAGAIMEEFHVYHQGFREDADAWLRDARLEK
jgi:hypothetical protein